MRFIVDAQLPPSLAQWLRDQGEDAVAVRDVNLRDADDRDIWKYASQWDAVIVTKDEDFASLARRDAAGPQVLWVRTGNIARAALLTTFEHAWGRLLPALQAGVRVVDLR